MLDLASAAAGWIAAVRQLLPMATASDSQMLHAAVKQTPVLHVDVTLWLKSADLYHIGIAIKTVKCKSKCCVISCILM